MHLEGTHEFAAPPSVVWQTLLDPACLASCLPGCEGMTATGADEYEAVLNVKVGPVNGVFKSRIHLANLDAPNCYDLIVEGAGGPGSLKGAGQLQLREADGVTSVSYAGDVQVTGTIARVGQRLLGSVAKMMVSRFFECMDGKVAALAAEATAGR